jgi:hypothetical protein
VRYTDPSVPGDLTGVDTWVAIDVHVSETGHVITTEFVAGDPRLFASLDQAASSWRFKPLLIDRQQTPFVLCLAVKLAWQTQPTKALFNIELRESR